MCLLGKGYTDRGNSADPYDRSEKSLAMKRVIKKRCKINKKMSLLLFCHIFPQTFVTFSRPVV